MPDWLLYPLAAVGSVQVVLWIIGRFVGDGEPYAGWKITIERNAAPARKLDETHTAYPAPPFD